MEGVGSKVKVIKSLIVVGGDVGYLVGLTANGRKVAKIEDNGIEWENGIDFIYRVYDGNGDLIAAIENCPTVVEYEAPVIETIYNVTDAKYEV